MGEVSDERGQAMNIGVGKYVYAALAAIEVPPVTRDATPELLKVFPVIADFNTTSPPTPFAVYRRTSATPNYTKSLWSGEITHHYTVTVVDNDYSPTVDIEQLVVDALMALSHTVKADMRFGQVMLTEIGPEEFTDGLFLQTLNFEINTNRI